MNNKHLVWLAALVLSVFLVLLTPSAAFLQGPGLSISVQNLNPKGFPTIEATVSVLDLNGLYVPNLSSGDLQILEDTLPSTISEVKTVMNPEAPIAVCLAIDVSGSMAGQPLLDARGAATTFVDNYLKPNDKACILAFSDQVDIGTSAASNPAKEVDLTNDKNRLKNLIGSLQADTQPGTPLYDGALKAIKMLATQPPGTRAVILFTDGKDERLNPITNGSDPGSVSTADRPITAAREAHIPVFTVGLGSDIDIRYLQRIAEETGGRYQQASASDKLTEMFQNIGSQLKTQYTLKYNSLLFPDGKDHLFQIRVKTSAGEAETRSSFKLDPKQVLTKPFMRLYYKEGEDRKDLVNDQKLKSMVTIAPQIATSSIVSYVAFSVDSTPVYTSTLAPYTFSWDTSRPQPFGLHTLTVRAVEDTGQYSEISARVETVETSLLGIIADLPMEAKVGTIAVVLVLLFLGITLVVARARPPRQMCPRGLHVMPPGATVCPFCASVTEFPTQNQPAPVQAAVPPPGFQGTNRGSSEEIPTVMPGVKTDIIAGGTSGGEGTPPMATVSLKRQPVNIAFLVMQNGDHPGQEYMLHPDETTIGRAGTSDIVVDDATVGRQQTKLRFEENGLFLYDMAATNPTFVNGKPVKGRRKLTDNDRIQMGNIVFVLKQAKGT